MKWKFFKRNEARPGRFTDNAADYRSGHGHPQRGRAVLLRFLAVLLCTARGAAGADGNCSKTTISVRRICSCCTICRQRDDHHRQDADAGSDLRGVGIREGINLFSLPIEERRKELLEQAPNIRDIFIVRRMPDKHRDHTSSNASPSRAWGRTDGSWTRRASCSSDTRERAACRPSEVRTRFGQIKPGEPSARHELAAVLRSTTRSGRSARVRILVVDTSKDDYLFLTMSDHPPGEDRLGRHCWTRRRIRKSGCKRQFDQLAKAMDSEIGRPCQLWDATHPGRIFATPPVGSNEGGERFYGDSTDCGA
jgi:hypothetical protein